MRDSYRAKYLFFRLVKCGCYECQVCVAADLPFAREKLEDWVLARLRRGLLTPGQFGEEVARLMAVTPRHEDGA